MQNPSSHAGQLGVIAQDGDLLFIKIVYQGRVMKEWACNTVEKPAINRFDTDILKRSGGMTAKQNLT